MASMNLIESFSGFPVNMVDSFVVVHLNYCNDPEISSLCTVK